MFDQISILVKLIIYVFLTVKESASQSNAFCQVNSVAKTLGAQSVINTT